MRLVQFRQRRASRQKQAFHTDGWCSAVVEQSGQGHSLVHRRWRAQSRHPTMRVAVANGIIDDLMMHFPPDRVTSDLRSNAAPIELHFNAFPRTDR